jgi:hypothetical protein
MDRQQAGRLAVVSAHSRLCIMQLSEDIESGDTLSLL